MSKIISKFSVDFRELVVGIVKDELVLTSNVEKIDAEKPDKYKALIDSFNGFVIISNYALGVYEYVSKGVYTNLGYDLSKFTNEEKTNFMFSIIKEDHRNFMFVTLFPTVLEYFKKNSTSSTGTDYRYSCCAQVKNVYDKYVWYLIDTVIIETDKNGFPIRTLITCTNIDQVKKDDCIYYNITKKNSDGVYQLMLEGTSDKRIYDLKLTTREIEIINLISRGNTNQEIAERLVISLHTVQTHRKNIMKKTKCSGTAELTNFAFSRGIL
jgi:DNA-binding CsgD family transcriptional regulator